MSYRGGNESQSERDAQVIVDESETRRLTSATPAEWCEKVVGEEEGKNSKVKEDISRRPMRMIAACEMRDGVRPVPRGSGSGRARYVPSCFHPCLARRRFRHR